MKILLITTRRNLNPGDQFIRMGVEVLLKELVPDAQLIHIPKEDEAFGTPVEFDKAILCGMPLWWDNPTSHSQDIGWWGPLMRGWMSERKNDFLALGVGSVMGKNHPVNMGRYISAIEETIQRSFAVVTRQPVLDHPQLISSICPAAFAAKWSTRRSRLVCNLMPTGAHDSHFNPYEASIWADRLPQTAEFLRSDGFEFCAHSDDEYALAQELGWPEASIHQFATPEEYMDLYNDTRVYSGNRMHGALVVAAGGGLAGVQGYDSRMEMVRQFTPRVFFPSDITLGNPIPVAPYYQDNRTLIEREKRVQLRVLNAFLHA